LALLLLAASVLPWSLPGAELALSILTNKGKPVPGAVVWLTPLEGQPLPPAQTGFVSPRRIEQKDKEFVPQLTVIPVGGTVEFPNQDTVQHHVYSLSPAKRFEIPLTGNEQQGSIRFDKPGVVTLGCNIHDWMVAYIVVLESPWHAESNADGLCVLRDIPPGRHRLTLWHPRLAREIVEELVISEERTTRSFSLKLKADRRVRRELEESSGNTYP